MAVRFLAPSIAACAILALGAQLEIDAMAATAPGSLTPVREYADASAMAAPLGEFVAEAAAKAIEARGKFVVAVSGGSLPKVSCPIRPAATRLKGLASAGRRRPRHGPGGARHVAAAADPIAPARRARRTSRRPWRRRASATRPSGSLSTPTSGSWPWTATTRTTRRPRPT